jgi:hypothetical protein
MKLVNSFHGSHTMLLPEQHIIIQPQRNHWDWFLYAIKNKLALNNHALSRSKLAKVTNRVSFFHWIKQSLNYLKHVGSLPTGDIEDN